MPPVQLHYCVHFINVCIINIRLHCSTTYIDAAYCYRLSSMVSVSLFVILVSPAKTAEPIEMLFGLRTRVGPENHVLDGGPDRRGNGQF